MKKIITNDPVKKERDKCNFRTSIKSYITFLILGTLMFINGCFGQQNSPQKILDYNKICISNVFLGDGITQLIEKMGNPDSTIYYYSEVIPSDSSRYFYYASSYFEVVNNKVLSFSCRDSMLIGIFPNVKVGENINLFLRKYPDMVFKDYIPSGEEYRVYAVIVGDKGDSYNGELHIIAHDNVITKFYFWIPY